jgi:hypothetical protein
VTPIRASSCGPAEGGLRVLDAACEPFPPGTFEPLELVPFLLQEIDLPRIGDEPTIDPTITYFAAISLTKRWDDFLFTLSYNRDASTTSQIGGLVSDTFSLAVSWYPPARPWRVNFYGSFGQREFPGEGFGLESLVRSSSIAGVSDVAESVGFRLIEVDRSQTLDIYQAGLYVAYDIAPRTQLYMNLTWERNEFDIEFQDAADRRWDRTRIAIGIIYTFPRINLPNLPI